MGNRYLLDTNILISGLLFKGNERKLLTLGREHKLFLLVSNIILEEFQKVLTEKFTFDREDMDLALAYVLESVQEIVEVEKSDLKQDVGSLRDKADVHVLAAARKGNAILVTGDRDILEIPESIVQIMRSVDVLKQTEGGQGEERQDRESDN